MTVTTHRTRSNVTTLKELRDNLGTKVNEAVFSGERPLISRNGKTVAALISYEDLKLLEEYEELLDIEALRKARAEDDGLPHRPRRVPRREPYRLVFQRILQGGRHLHQGGAARLILA